MRHRSQKKDIALKLMLTACLGAAVMLSACGSTSKVVSSLRLQTTSQIAGPAHLIRADIPVGEFTLLSYERVLDRGKPVTVYIDGDGAIVSDYSVKGDPTPIEPVALRMAAQDGMDNVIYLGRPCQYTDLLEVRACTRALYTTHRYSPQIIDAMNAGLDNIKHRYDVSSFNLVGYEGGAAIAVELAAVRDDVKSLKTVAGILDTKVAAAADAKSKTRGEPKDDPYAGSLNPVDAAPRVAHIPQTHSVASWDKATSLQMINNFMAAEGNPTTATTAIAPADMAPQPLH